MIMKYSPSLTETNTITIVKYS